MRITASSALSTFPVCHKRDGPYALRASPLLFGFLRHATDSPGMSIGAQMPASHNASSAEIVGIMDRCGSLCGGAWTQLWASNMKEAFVLSSFLFSSAVLSMAETSIVTLWPWKVQKIAMEEHGNGVFQMLHNDANRFMMTILIGKTIFNIGATVLVTKAARSVFGRAGVGIAASVMIMTILLLTEIAPKCIAVNYAQEIAKFVVTPVAWLSWLLYPVGRIANSVSVGILEMLNLNSQSKADTAVGSSSLRVRRAELVQRMKEQEKTMIKNVLKMKGTIVREVMTPLTDVVAIDAGAKLVDFKKLWISRKCSRVPVFERLNDNIIGVAYVKDLVTYVKEADKMNNSNVGEIARRPAYFVSDSLSIKDLLREFRLRKVHMGVVTDDNGVVTGIVTLDDVIQEIFGNLDDDNHLKVMNETPSENFLEHTCFMHCSGH